MTSEQLSALLSALQSIQLAVQDGASSIIEGPVQISEVAIQSQQIAELSQRLYVVQGLEIILICFVALLVGVGLGNILARWFR